MKRSYLLLLPLLAIESVTAQTTWNIDKPHSRIGFSVTHMGISEVEGDFNDFDAKVVSRSDDFNGTEVEFTASVASVDTENERRDTHLKSDDFFNAAKFPELSFKGKLVKTGNNYTLKGELTIRGVTKEESFAVAYGGTVDTGRGIKAGFKVNGTIDRQAYGLTWNNKLAGGELIVGDEVNISCKIELNKT